MSLQPESGTEVYLRYLAYFRDGVVRRVAAMDEDGPHYNAEQVTGARQENVVRWVLLVSLLLGIIAMSAVWIIPALTR